MKNPFKSIASLTGRRDELNARLADVDAEISQLRDARSQQLLAGELVTGAIGIAAQLEEREALAGVISTLSGQISGLKAEADAAHAVAARQQLERDFAEAVTAAESARASLNHGLRDAIKNVAALFDEAKAMDAAAREKASLVGASYGPTLWYSMAGANVGHAFVQARNIELKSFEPEPPARNPW